MAYNYGKSFKKDGKNVRYRYTDKKASSKKLVSAPQKTLRKVSSEKSSKLRNAPKNYFSAKYSRK
jgi:hypothetical protein